ncbi:MAG: class I SAM-dependent methyltransferase, partial [Hyphomicrobium sp.]
MADERFEVEGDGVRYHAHYAAQHVVRYAIVRELVRGKRVLDIACGSGYGSKLLSDWGASEVVGADISAQAVDTANRHFSGPGRRFIVIKGEDLAEHFPATEKFDVIVSFETIEHVQVPKLFLRAMARLIAPDGIIAISCPNESSYGMTPGENPYHLSSYTFDEFRSVAEAELGPATQWLIGAPVLGEMNFVKDDEMATVGQIDPKGISKVTDLARASMLPAQGGTEVTLANCSHYAGIWGAKPNSNAAVSAMSLSAFSEPWRAIEWYKGLLAEFERSSAEYIKNVQHYEKASLDHKQERLRLEMEIQEVRSRYLFIAEQVSKRGLSPTTAVAGLSNARTVGELQENYVALAGKFTKLEKDHTSTKRRLAAVDRSRTMKILRYYRHLYRIPVVG